MDVNPLILHQWEAKRYRRIQPALLLCPYSLNYHNPNPPIYPRQTRIQPPPPPPPKKHPVNIPVFINIMSYKNPLDV